MWRTSLRYAKEVGGRKKRVCFDILHIAWQPALSYYLLSFPKGPLSV
jgi:hypothetical protein